MMEWLPRVGLVVLVGLLVALLWPRIVSPRRQQRAIRALAQRAGLEYGGRRAGRAFGTYRGRSCAVETFQEEGSALYLRVILSVDNPAEGSVHVLGAPGAASTAPTRPLSIGRTVPPHFGPLILQAADLPTRLPQVARQIHSTGYGITLDGHLLRFEHRPRSMATWRVVDYAQGLHALLDLLCDTGEAIDRVPAA